MNIQENNKLIAEFMDIDTSGKDIYIHEHERLVRVPYEYTCEESCLYTLETLKYHKSWDWLMPVVEKINYKVADTWRIVQIGIGTKYVDVTNFNTSDLFYYNTGNNIEDTYNCCIDVIKALNNNEI